MIGGRGRCEDRSGGAACDRRDQYGTPSGRPPFERNTPRLRSRPPPPRGRRHHVTSHPSCELAQDVELDPAIVGDDAESRRAARRSRARAPSRPRSSRRARDVTSATSRGQQAGSARARSSRPRRAARDRRDDAVLGAVVAEVRVSARVSSPGCRRSPWRRKIVVEARARAEARGDGDIP